MSGHSKWANIKHRKGRQDAKRGKLFGKLIRAVEAAAREAGGDAAGNPTLATAIQKAKDASVPRGSIERAMARGSGDLDGVRYEEIWYEGYGPGGVALFVRVLTDNRNRATSGVRAIFSKHGGNLGEPGSVAYLFEQKGYVLAEADEDTVMIAALEGGRRGRDGIRQPMGDRQHCGGPGGGTYSSGGSGGHDRPSGGDAAPDDLSRRGRGVGPQDPSARRCARGPGRCPGCVCQFRHPGRGAVGHGLRASADRRSLCASFLALRLTAHRCAARVPYPSRRVRTYRRGVILSGSSPDGSSRCGPGPLPEPPSPHLSARCQSSHGSSRCGPGPLPEPPSPHLSARPLSPMAGIQDPRSYVPWTCRSTVLR